MTTSLFFLMVRLRARELKGRIARLITNKGGDNMRRGSTFTRRELLAAGAALGGTVVLGGMPSRMWAAPASQSAPPVVDRLAVRVVVGDTHDAIARSGQVGNVEVQRVGWALGPNLGKQLHSEFGLGFHVESHRGAEI